MVAAPAAGRAQDDRVAVRLDGRPLFRVGASDSTTAAQRALRIERRLATLLEADAPVTPPRVEAGGAGSAARVITVSGVPVVTVTPGDAADNVAGVDALAARWARSLDSALVQGRARRGSPWARFGTEVQASVTAAFGRLAESILRVVPRVLAALLVVGLFWLLAAGARWLLRAVFARVVDDRTVENLVKQVTYYAIWALGLLVAVGALGFDPQTVVTGLGLTGLALGFALKDIISNFVAGLLLLALRPFRLGDQIVVGETEGGVERIELRATQIRTYDGRLVLVPNAELFTSRVTNNTASAVRRATVPLFLGYDADLPRALGVARDAVVATAGVLADPPADVRVRDLGQDDLVLEARFWTDSTRSDFMATQAAVRAAIVAAFQAARIGLPDPDVRALALRDPARWRAALGARADGGAPPAGDFTPPAGTG